VRDFKSYLLLYLKGLAMGTADVIPGVSGGTIAFITGIYDELVNSIRAVNFSLFKILLTGNFSAFWKQLNGNFLISVLAGIATSLITLAGLMSWLLVKYPIQVWSFFFGLILISAPLIFKEIKSWATSVYISLIAGVMIAYAITVLSPAETPESLWFIFLCGVLAICAMILPGISGAFILLLIGKYQFMISALITVNLPVILVFVSGCVIGLTSFSHVLNWMLTKHRDITLGLLAGFMLGSLNKVWPWKEITEWRLNHAGEKVAAFDRSIMPWNYTELTGGQPLVLQAVLFCLLGIMCVVVLEKGAEMIKRREH
jgi:putative membrane protein